MNIGTTSTQIIIRIFKNINFEVLQVYTDDFKVIL